MGPQKYARIVGIIVKGDPPAFLWALSSGLIGIYLRSYQFGLAVLRLMQ